MERLPEEQPLTSSKIQYKTTLYLTSGFVMYYFSGIILYNRHQGDFLVGWGYDKKIYLYNPFCLSWYITAVSCSFRSGDAVYTFAPK